MLKLGVLIYLAFGRVAAIPHGSEGRRESPESKIMGNNQKADEFNNFNNEHEYSFTNEEIKNERWISMDSTGIESIASDEEVIAILEKAARINSSFIYTPSFSNESDYSNNVNKRSIIGSDNRYWASTTSFPGRAIGYLETGCTAFLIGPYHAVTAAHCVYENGEWLSNLNLHIQRNCVNGQYGHEMTWRRVWIKTVYKNTEDENYDFAWILYDSSDYHSSWLGIAYRNPMPTISGEVCGYPGDKKKATINPPNCYFCGSCSGASRINCGWWGRNCKRIRHTCDTAGGTSGAPFYTDDHDSSSSWYTYGVHAHGYSTYNAAVRITKERFETLVCFMCDNGGYFCNMC